VIFVKVEFTQDQHDQPDHHHFVSLHHTNPHHKMSDDGKGYVLSPEEEECLKDRKWWCFLLSSIFTFLAGLTIVLIWRGLSMICCRKDASPEYSQSDLKQQNLPKPPRQAKEEFEGTFVTDAKDWAGELISGQTTTGRILVSFYPSIHPSNQIDSKYRPTIQTVLYMRK
jgi:potassium large conductance calcium-activated channel subfamily M alpha protein 1